MRIGSLEITFKSKKAKAEPVEEQAQPTALAGIGVGYGTAAYTAPYNGQNALGEMAPPINYVVDHDTLMIRSWQLYLESSNYKTIMKRLKDTVIGGGLKLQCAPVVNYLKKSGIDLELEKFNSEVEDMWNLYANSRMADYAGKNTLGEVHARAYLNSIVAGTVLVILRPVNNVVKVQLVDGIYLQTPINFAFATEDKINYNAIERINPDTGNRVRWGVEIDSTGRHVAYYVRTGYGLNYQRVEAYGKKSGSLMAYILTDEDFRVDSEKGLPRLSAGMETASQLNRYKSATVSAAEEIAKAPYFIKHDLNSTGEDPRIKDLTKAYDIDRPSASSQLDYSAEGKAIANTVNASTNRTVTNMPPGSELVALESGNQLHFEPFNKAVIEEQAALAGIPPEIVASKFDSNFSASRAAFLAEGMRLAREWGYQGNHFLQPIYNLQMDIWVYSLEINAPGYLQALQEKNEYVLVAYRMCIWEGEKLGHIDPLKEANYWRAILGEGSKHLPIGTFEQAAKALGLGDAVANMSQYAKEMEEGDALGIEQQDKLTEDDTEATEKEEE